MRMKITCAVTDLEALLFFPRAPQEPREYRVSKE